MKILIILINLEETMKSKKERQKLEKKNREGITNIKLEPNEETNEVIAEVVTNNRFEPLPNTSDNDDDDPRMYKSFQPSENRKILSFWAGSHMDITPVPKISKAVQTSTISTSEVSKEYEKYACFYCERD